MKLRLDRRAALALLGVGVAEFALAENDKMNKIRILVLCTGNSCRSQMTQGFLKSFDSGLEVHSAGTEPSEQVNPYAVRVMKEVGIDISGGEPKHVKQFLDQPFDYVVTVCDDADKNCPYFTGKVGKRLHIGFEDPAEAEGTEEELLAVFRETRDQIRSRFRQFYEREIERNRETSSGQ